MFLSELVVAGAMVALVPCERTSSSCLTVFNLAYDATEREAHILFSGCEGYVRCIVVPGKGMQKPYAFVQFTSQASALAAMESRQGTTWEEDMTPVSLELARRDIPERFGPRQTRIGEVTQWVDPPLSATPPWLIGRSTKRTRTEEVPTIVGVQPLAVVEDGPRTLHLGGLPSNVSQEDLNAFLHSNLAGAVIGSKLTDSGGKGSGRAFVGFVSHSAAVEAQAWLEGSPWNGSILHAEWARTEFRPHGGATRPEPPVQHHVDDRGVPTPRSRHPPLTPLASAPPLGSKTGWRGSVKREGEQVLRTLHFTNLPNLSEEEFGQFLTANFPNQIEAARFLDARDGRPPVAWVLFFDESCAAVVVGSHQSFEFHGSQVAVQYARTELQHSRVRH